MFCTWIRGYSLSQLKTKTFQRLPFTKSPNFHKLVPTYPTLFCLNIYTLVTLNYCFAHMPSCFTYLCLHSSCNLCLVFSSLLNQLLLPFKTLLASPPGSLLRVEPSVGNGKTTPDACQMHLTYLGKPQSFCHHIQRGLLAWVAICINTGPPLWL